MVKFIYHRYTVRNFWIILVLTVYFLKKVFQPYATCGNWVKTITLRHEIYFRYSRINIGSQIFLQDCDKVPTMNFVPLWMIYYCALTGEPSWLKEPPPPWQPRNSLQHTSAGWWRHPKVREKRGLPLPPQQIEDTTPIIISTLLLLFLKRCR